MAFPNELHFSTELKLAIDEYLRAIEPARLFPPSMLALLPFSLPTNDELYIDTTNIAQTIKAAYWGVNAYSHGDYKEYKERVKRLHKKGIIATDSLSKAQQYAANEFGFSNQSELKIFCDQLDQAVMDLGFADFHSFSTPKIYLAHKIKGKTFNELGFINIEEYNKAIAVLEQFSPYMIDIFLLIKSRSYTKAYTEIIKGCLFFLQKNGNDYYVDHHIPGQYRFHSEELKSPNITFSSSELDYFRNFMVRQYSGELK